MRKYILLICIVLLIPFTAMADGDFSSNVYVIDGQSGVTMQENTSGVSLLFVFENRKEKPSNAVFSLEPGTWVLAAGTGPADRLNPGTGNSDDSGSTFQYLYAISNKELTTAQWETKGTKSAVTSIGTWTIGGVTDNPVQFTPGPAAWMGIFARSSGLSAFLVPTETRMFFQ